MEHLFFLFFFLTTPIHIYVYLACKGLKFLLGKLLCKLCRIHCVRADLVKTRLSADETHQLKALTMDIPWQSNALLEETPGLC